jgi:hypothetical protein
MGAYLNPKSETKEAFLQREGQEINRSVAQDWNDFEEVLLVVLVKNATFSVAGIAYDPTERDVFTDRDEKRPCRFFLVEKAKLLPESNLALLSGEEKMMNRSLNNHIKRLILDGKAIVSTDNEWNGVEEALFFAQRNMETFPIEAQWLLNRIGNAKVDLIQRVSCLSSSDAKHQ